MIGASVVKEALFTKKTFNEKLPFFALAIIYFDQMPFLSFKNVSFALDLKNYYLDFQEI